MILVRQEVETEEMISDATALKKALKFFDANFFNDSKVIVHHVFIYPGGTFRDNTQIFLKLSSSELNIRLQSYIFL